MTDALTAEQPRFHMWTVVEDGCTEHWVIAPDAESAIAEVRGMSEPEDIGDLEAVRMPDGKAWPVTWVDDKSDTDEVNEYEGLDGFAVDRSGPHAVVTATAGRWAEYFGKVAYTGCSEY